MKEALKSHLVSRPVVLLLAAGSAARFGGDKRRARFASRKTLIQQTISQYRQLGLPVYLCLSGAKSDDDLAHTLASDDLVCIRCDRANEGMGATLSQGIGAVANAARVFVALGDMPVVSLKTLKLLEENADDARIVFPRYRGRRGHPVIFGRVFFEALGRLSGDRGASGLLRDHAECCLAIDVDDPGVLLDVDTPKDLERALALFDKRSSSDSAL